MPPKDHANPERMRWRADKVNEYAKLLVPEVSEKRSVGMNLFGKPTDSVVKILHIPGCDRLTPSAMWQREKTQVRTN